MTGADAGGREVVGNRQEIKMILTMWLKERQHHNNR